MAFPFIIPITCIFLTLILLDRFFPIDFCASVGINRQKQKQDSPPHPCGWLIPATPDSRGQELVSSIIPLALVPTSKPLFLFRSI